MCIRDRVKDIPRDENRRPPTLRLSLWGQEDHEAIWSICRSDEGSTWYKDKENLKKYLEAMTNMADFIRKIADDNKINLKIDFVEKNDFRFFLVKRTRSFFGMVIIFTTFNKNSVEEQDFLNTGFITKSQNGYIRMNEMIEKLHDRRQQQNEENSSSQFPIDREFIKNIDDYFNHFFGLGENCGVEGVSWQSEPDIWIDKFYEQT